MTNNSNNNIIILSVLAIMLSIASIFFTAGIVDTNPSSLIWSVKETPDKELDIFLSGPSAVKVEGADVRVFFDIKKYKVASVTDGGFFNDPIIVNYDSSNLIYSLIVNPENMTTNNLLAPVLKFRLSPAPESTSVFSVLKSSQVYVKGIGGEFPK